ncbi:2-hydroxyacid dehydrogenase [Paracoccus sp. 22332]|uniref:2-hydroxyacid dehydrogenase n=1 Tax=Paracoccus sp. 22332 TaxID=3453913 RepID=UPI003F85C73A
MDMRPTILKMGPLMPELEAALTSRFDVIGLSDVTESAARISGIATSTRYPITTDLLDRLPALRVISSFGVGMDHLPLEAAKARGIAVHNTPGVLDDDTASMALALALAVTRRIVSNHLYVACGEWGRAAAPPLGVSLSGKTVGIAGLGAIGSIVAKRFCAFGCHIAYFGRRRRHNCDYDFHGNLETLAAASDLLVATLPGGPQTQGIIDAAVFRALGSQGYFINIGRGSTLDQPALIEALRNGTIAGAGLDVFQDEPEVPKAMFTMSNVVLQPHQASATAETRARMADLVLENLVRHYTERAAC